MTVQQTTITSKIVTTRQNHSKTNSEHLNESSVKRVDENTEGELVTKSATYKPKLIWTYFLPILGVHIGGLYGLFLLLTEAKLLTITWTVFLNVLGILGTTMGAHRFYTHRSFKANKCIELTLVAIYSLFAHRSIWRWVLDHRQHHKYSDTDADPLNATRGYFFCSIGWFFYEQHPEVLRTKRTIDVSDMERNPIASFHKKYYYWIFALIAIIFPTIVPYYFWHEDLYCSLFVCFFFRYAIMLQGNGFCNSMVHMRGKRPFNRGIHPRENLFASILSLGDGWHNFHHAFPWDYRAAQYGQNWNLTATIIDYCAKKGWAYDLKEASPELVKKYSINRGDGSHPVYGKFTL